MGGAKQAPFKCKYKQILQLCKGALNRHLPKRPNKGTGLYKQTVLRTIRVNFKHDPKESIAESILRG